jgi:DNA-binding transcriptional LysR family regulator
MNWSDLQVLLTFKREGTLQKAAEKLQVDISTVSRRIRALESALGAKLVENTSGRLVLTNSGEKAVLTAEVMEAQSNGLETILKGEESSPSGVLRVALLDMFLHFHRNLLQSFIVQYPQISLELISTTTLVHSLNRREADVAIRATNHPDDTLVGMLLLHTEYAVYAHRDVVAQSVEWSKLPWIGWDVSANARMTDDWMEKNVPTEQVYFRVDSPLAQFIMTEAGDGVCILPMAYANLSKNLIQLSDPLKGFGMDVWLLTHRDLKHNGRVQAFFQHFYNGLETLRNNKN